jgi:flagellar hook-associated protein FlgK
MKKRINSLKTQLKKLEDKIQAVEDQLPAHSVKPPIMTKLFELEDQRDALLKELEELDGPTAGNTI